MIENNQIDIVKGPTVNEDFYDYYSDRNAHVNSIFFHYCSSVIALSSEHVYVKDKLTGDPLLVCGAYRPSYFSSYRELWMAGTTKLARRHLKEIKLNLAEWADAQTVPLFARASSIKSQKFLTFLGFTVFEVESNIITYRW